MEFLFGIETIKTFNLELELNGETEKRFIKLMKSAFKTGLIINLQCFIKSMVKLIA